MEIQVKLEIQETSKISSKDDVAKLIKYMSGVGAIIFEEQFDQIGIALSEEVKKKLKSFSQVHSDFFSCLEVFDETNRTLSATFIAGWSGRECAKELKAILNMFDGLDFIID